MLMNDLAKRVNDLIAQQGIKKVWIADKIGISQQLLNKRLNKDNFTIDDANGILSAIGYKVTFDIVKTDHIDKV